MSGSLSSILSVARSGLQTHQTALQIAGQNLANATTEGYSRQRAEIVPGTPVRMPFGSLGTGVRIADVTRARDQVLDPAVRRESASAAGAELRNSALGELESVLAESVDLGLGPALDGLFNAFSDLANDPLSNTARVAVVSAGIRVTDEFGRAADTVDRVLGGVAQSLDLTIGEANRAIQEIAELNGRIAAASSSGSSAPDLEDRRDLAIDRLSRLVPVETVTGPTGAVGVRVDGVSVVEGTFAQTLSLSVAGTDRVLTTGSGAEINPDSGALGSALTLLNDDFAFVRSELDAMASALVERVNVLHAAGVGPLGATGVNFFDDLGDPTTVTARTLSLSTEILASSENVVAGSPGPLGGYQPGVNDLALALSAVRDNGTPGLLGGRSIGEASRDLLGDLGVRVAESRDAEQRHGTLLAAARERRESVSGVVTDEELVSIVQIQAAYQASARMVNVVDEMYQTLLSI